MGGYAVGDTNQDGIYTEEEKAIARAKLAEELKKPGGHGNKLRLGHRLGKLTEESASAKQQRNDLNETGLASNQFAEYAGGGYQALTEEARAQREYLRRLASGQDSVSAEQLRQANQQQLAAQRSMAAGASPQNQAMAARTAAIQMGRAQSGLAGQQAIAGMQERQAAQQGLANMIMQQRGQDLQGVLGSRQTAVGAYGGVKPEGSTMDKYAAPVSSGLAALFSDRRLKTDIKSGDDEADRALKGLRAYVYRYKNPEHGEGRRLGIIAQDLEKAGLGHAVENGPDGKKRVKAAELATSLAAMMPGINKRLERLEDERDSDDDDPQAAREYLRSLVKRKARVA